MKNLLMFGCCCALCIDCFALKLDQISTPQNVETERFGVLTINKLDLPKVKSYVERHIGIPKIFKCNASVAFYNFLKYIDAKYIENGEELLSTIMMAKMSFREVYKDEFQKHTEKSVPAVTFDNPYYSIAMQAGNDNDDVSEAIQWMIMSSLYYIIQHKDKNLKVIFCKSEKTDTFLQTSVGKDTYLILNAEFNGAMGVDRCGISMADRCSNFCHVLSFLRHELLGIDIKFVNYSEDELITYMFYNKDIYRDLSANDEIFANVGICKLNNGLIVVDELCNRSYGIHRRSPITWDLGISGMYVHGKHSGSYGHGELWPSRHLTDWARIVRPGGLGCFSELSLLVDIMTFHTQDLLFTVGRFDTQFVDSIESSNSNINEEKEHIVERNKRVIAQLKDINNNKLIHFCRFAHVVLREMLSYIYKLTPGLSYKTKRQIANMISGRYEKFPLRDNYSNWGEVIIDELYQNPNTWILLSHKPEDPLFEYRGETKTVMSFNTLQQHAMQEIIAILRQEWQWNSIWPKLPKELDFLGNIWRIKSKMN